MLGRKRYSYEMEMAYVFATTAEAFYDRPSKLEREGICWCRRAGDGVARPVGTTFRHGPG